MVIDVVEEFNIMPEVNNIAIIEVKLVTDTKAIVGIEARTVVSIGYIVVIIKSAIMLL